MIEWEFEIMRTIQLQNKYEGSVVVDDDKKKIMKLHCMCYDFLHRRIHKVGNNMEFKRYATPCKHLIKVFDAFIKQGYILRVPIVNGGAYRLTAKLRKGVYKAWEKQCFIHGCEETENLHIHRIIRGNAGGKYSILNCRPFCQKHHQEIHGKEPGNY